MRGDASRLTAGGNGALPWRRAVRLQQLSDPRVAVKGMTSELDAFWFGIHRNVDRSCRLKAHATEEPRPSTLEAPPVEPPDDEDPPVLPQKLIALVVISRVLSGKLIWHTSARAGLYRSYVIMIFGAL